ncbi:MAG TPA: hypothetical protein ENI87_10670 [bacterium]|nr:hypothetical protein [bacterium]
MTGVTAFVFAGLNGAEHTGEPAIVNRPGFRRRWRQVQATFAEQAGFAAFDAALLAGRRLPADSHTWRWRALAVVAAQLAAAEHVEQLGERPDWLCGYSIGDVARSCHAGAATFAQVLAFAQALPTLPETAGATVAVCTPTEQAAPPLRARLAAEGLAVSTLSPRFLLFAGDEPAVPAAIAMCREAGARPRRIASCPLHTARQRELTLLLTAHLRRARFTDPTHNVFSTTLARPLTLGDELRRELGENAARTLDFAAAVRALHERHRVTRFVDLGPGRHAMRFIRHHRLPVTAVSAGDLLVNATAR